MKPLVHLLIVLLMLFSLSESSEALDSITLIGFSLDEANKSDFPPLQVTGRILNWDELTGDLYVLFKDLHRLKSKLPIEHQSRLFSASCHFWINENNRVRVRGFLADESFLAKGLVFNAKASLKDTAEGLGYSSTILSFLIGSAIFGVLAFVNFLRG